MVADYTPREIRLKAGYDPRLVKGARSTFEPSKHRASSLRPPLPLNPSYPSMRPRIVHRFFEQSSPLFRHTSVFGCMGRCGEYLSPGAAWHKAYCMCSKYTIGPGRERQGSLPSPMVFALSIGFNGFTVRLRAHGLMRMVVKKFTRYLAIPFAPRETVKLNKNFLFFFFISQVASRGIFRVIFESIGILLSTFTKNQ